jgi:hypothetical protein
VVPNVKMIPRSLAIASPYRGRSLRFFLGKVPGWKRCHEILSARTRRRVTADGRRRLEAGEPEGRRFLAAIPHQFCGIGHSFCEWNTARQWSGRLGMEFVNVPLASPWAVFLGFGAQAPVWHDLRRLPRLRIVRLPYADWSGSADAFGNTRRIIETVRSPDPLLFVLADGQNEFDHTVNTAQLRQEFLDHGDWRVIPDHRVPGRLNVAVHIRRGDVAAMKARGDGNWNERFLGLDWFERVMASIVAEQQDGAVPVFHLYSQGTPADFIDFGSGLDVVYHLNVDDRETLFNMIQAEMLVMSPSGFSYLAAILSTGRKIARVPWWHHLPEAEGWLLLGHDGAVATVRKL